MPTTRRWVLPTAAAASLAGLALHAACSRRSEPELMEPVPRGISFVGPRRPAPAPNELVARYGRPKYSQYLEELIARDVFGNERNGVFVDVGAGDALFNSTTAFLEKDLGWTGIAIDAEPKHLESYLKNRRGTRFFAYFVGDRDGKDVDFWVNDADWRVSSGVKSFAEARGRHHGIKVPEITLTTLLDREGVRRIDFLSMDIEQGEPAALAGFDIRRFHPRLACIELQSATTEAILAYMSSHGWVEVERYRQFDSVNGWFVPARDGAAGPAPTPRAAQK